MPEALDTYRDRLPESVTFNTTHVCNYKCTYCPYHSKLLSQERRRVGAPGHMLRLEEFRAQVDPLASYYRSQGAPLFNITFSGLGEPFLNKELVPIMAHSADLGCRFRVVSNFSEALTPHIDDLVNMGIHIFYTNLDGASKEEYEATRPGAHYETTLRNIEKTAAAIERAGTDTILEVHFIITPENYASLPEVVRILHGVGVKRVFAKLVVEMEYSIDNLFFTDLEKHQHLFDVVREGYEVATSRGMIYTTPHYSALMANINTLPLPVMRERIAKCFRPTILWLNFGMMHYTREQLLGNACLACPIRRTPEGHFGNILELGVEGVINHPNRLRLMQQLENETPPEVCKTCEYQYMGILPEIERRMVECGALNDAAATLLAKGDTQAAEEQFRAVLALDAADVRAHDGLARILDSRQQHEQALHHAKKAAAFAQDREAAAKLVQQLKDKALARVAAR